MATPEWLRYVNQGATRNQPLSDDLVRALSFLPDLGVTMEVFSGGQPSSGPGRVGSHRHDLGNAADVFFYQDGRRLDWDNPQDRSVLGHIVAQGRQAGITGIGAGDGYMQPGSMHVGFGPEAVWGAGGRSANAPDWLQQAYYNPQALPPLPPMPIPSAGNALDAANALAGAPPTRPDAWSAFTAEVSPPLPRMDPRGAPQTVPFPWNDGMQQAEAGRDALFQVGLDPTQTANMPAIPPMPPSRPGSFPYSTAQAPMPPMPPERPQGLGASPMATFAGQTTGGNPVETAGQFLGDFQNNGGLLGMGLNAMLGRGLFPGDEGVIPQFKQGVADRTAELNGDFLGGLFSRRAGPAPTFSTSRPEGRSVSATRVGPSGVTQGYLTESQKPRMGEGNYNASVRDANMNALRGVEGRTMKEKIDNFQRSGGTLYKA